MEAEIQQPWVINGHNTHTPESRKACQAIAFYDNFISQRSQPMKIKSLSVVWIRFRKRHGENPADSIIPAASHWGGFRTTFTCETRTYNISVMELQCTVYKYINSNYVYFGSLASAHDSATMALEGAGRPLEANSWWRFLLADTHLRSYHVLPQACFPQRIPWRWTRVSICLAHAYIPLPLTRKIHALLFLSCAMRVGAVCSYPSSSIVRLRYTQSSAHCDTL